MPINIALTTTNVPHGDLTQQHERLLPVGAINDTVNQLFGAPAGAQRNLIMAVFNPTAERLQQAREVLNLGADVGSAYGMAAVIAMLNAKGGPLVAADFGSAHVVPVLNAFNLDGKRFSKYINLRVNQLSCKCGAIFNLRSIASRCFFFF